MTQHPREIARTKRQRLAALIDLAREKGLAITGIEEGRGGAIRVLTGPLPESQALDDDAARWLRENAGAGKAGRRA